MQSSRYCFTEADIHQDEEGILYRDYLPTSSIQGQHAAEEGPDLAELGYDNTANASSYYGLDFENLDTSHYNPHSYNIADEGRPMDTFSIDGAVTFC